MANSNNLKAGQRVRIRIPGGQRVEGVILAANAAMATFQPGPGEVVVLRRDLFLVKPVWTYQGLALEIEEVPEMPHKEFNRRLMALAEKARKQDVA